jgi:hypothetical protein
MKNENLKYALIMIATLAVLVWIHYSQAPRLERYYANRCLQYGYEADCLKEAK